MFIAELRDPENLTASKYRELPPGARDDFAVCVWGDAVKFVRKHPPRPLSDMARQTLAGLLDSMLALDWPARTGANDRAVYAALIHFGLEGATTEVSASIRQLGKHANLSNNGTVRAVGRLRDRRLVERLPAPGHGFANKYRLLPVMGAVPKVSTSEDNNGLSMGGQRILLSSPAPLLDDIFSNGTGLGLSCRESWEALPEGPTKVAELTRLRPGSLQRATVRGHLRVLRDHGLAGRRGHQWWRIQPNEEDLQRLASMLGVLGKTAARADYNQRQVAAYRDRFAIHVPSPDQETA